MVVVPTACAVAKPLQPGVVQPAVLLIVANLVTDDFQFARAVTSSIMGDVEGGNVPVAVYCWVPDTWSEAFTGETAIPCMLAVVPIPETLTVCGLVLALSTKVIVPARAPSCVGINVTRT
jgi:hypothetical protein